MTTETTELAPQAADSVQRNSYMAALALAEQLMNVTTVLPTNVDVQVHAWSPSLPQISFYFHRNLEALRKFAAEQQLTESVTTRDNGSVYTEAVRQSEQGVRVVAWTLSDAKPSAVTA